MANSTTNRSRHPHRLPSARRQILHPSRDSATRQAALAAMRGALEKAGFDLPQSEEMRSKSRAELQTALARYRAEADGRAPAMQTVVARSAEHWLGGNRIVSALAPADSFFSVSAADAITVTPGIDLTAQTIAPFANTAQITVDQSGGGSLDGFLEFLFSWQNPTAQDLMCTLTGMLGVTATAIVTADSYWWPLSVNPISVLEVFAEFDVTLVDAFGNITSPPNQSTQVQPVVSLAVEGALFEGTIAGQDIFRGYVLQHSGLIVPAGAKLELSLTCEISWFADDGGCQFVAAGDGREVSAFGVFINAEPAPLRAL
jgi:hypothetical protein